MAHPLAVGEVYSTKIFMKAGNQGAVNTVHHRVTAVTGTVLDDELALQMDLGVSTPLTLLLSEEATYQGVQVQRIFPLPKTIPVQNSTTTGVGTPGRVALPKQVAGLIRKRTAFAGKQFRGRVYVPFPSETDNIATGGIPSSTYKTNMLSYAAVILGNFSLAPGGGGTAALVPVLWHELTNTSTDLIAPIASPFWGSQKRRGDYGQTNRTPFD